MAKVYTFPHWETSVIDKSIYTPLDRELLPLFRPIFFMKTQQGPAGVPVWVNTTNEFRRTFGEGTLDETTPYFSRESVFLKNLFIRQGAFIVRMVDASAKKGSMVLELRVKTVQVPQYERDLEGNWILDVHGEKKPLQDEGHSPVKEEGVELKWAIRTLAEEETIDNLKPVTVGSEDGYTTYPILAAEATSVGAFANDVGLKFFADLDDMDTTLAFNVNAMPYTFGAVKKTYGQDTVSAIMSNLQTNFETFVAKPGQQDTRTARNVSFEDIISNYYDGDRLPFNVHLYSDNIKTVGEKIQAVEPEDDTLVDPFMANLTEAYNINDVPYAHVVMSEEEDAVVLNDTRILYLAGGEDGATDEATIEELTRQYLKDLVYPELLDQPRYPFTHIIDTGVTIDTKYAFIDFLGDHDAFKVVLSTQDATMGRLNTKAEDLSTGAALYARCLLQPESVIKGTECCRAEIYQQAGYLADSTYRGVIPATLDIMNKKSLYNSTDRITGVPAGLPRSEITIFKEYNWVPCDADHKQKSWDSGLNYFQHYDMTGVHWPAMRSVYRYDTSVLSSAHYTDAVVFVKHIARYNWSRFAGVEQKFEDFKPRAEEALSQDLSYMLNGRYDHTVEFYQTEEEAKIGYISHCNIQLWGNPQQRVWRIDIECYRNGFDPEANQE